MKKAMMILAGFAAVTSLSAASSPAPAYTVAGLAAAKTLVVQSVARPGTCTGAQYGQLVTQCIETQCKRNPLQPPAGSCILACQANADRACGVQ